MVEFPSEAVRKLSQIRPASTFLTVRNYTNNFGELSDFSIAFHVNYLNAVRRAKHILQYLKLNKKLIEGKSYSLNDLMLARKELLESFEDSLSGYNPRYTQHNTYDLINCEGKVVPGIKLHLRQGLVHLNGVLAHKVVKSAGTYPESYHSRFTLAKKYLRGLTPLSKFRQFKLVAGKFESLKVEKMDITLAETVLDNE